MKNLYLYINRGTMVNFATTGIKGLRPRIHHLRVHHSMPNKDKLASEIMNELNPNSLSRTGCMDSLQITKQASELNKIVEKQIKEPPKAFFPKASEEDLKMLLDSTQEGSALRTVYTNPKTGRVYNLLLVGKTENGENIIRVLDDKGAYVKRLKVRPKTIAILDSFNQGPAFNDKSLYQIMDHGDKVKILAQRTNPFAEYITINCRGSDNIVLTDQGFAELQKMIDKGIKVDYVSCSFGIGTEYTINELERELGMSLDEASRKGIYSPNVVHDFIKKNPSIRLFKSAGNLGENHVGESLLNPRIEGVGSLDEYGNIAKHSSSRFVFCTPHYEEGVLPYKVTHEGLSFAPPYFNTTDIRLSENAPEIIKKFHGKKLKLVSNEELETFYALKKKCHDIIFGEKLRKAEEEFAKYSENLASEGKMIKDSNGNYYLANEYSSCSRTGFKVDSDNNLIAVISPLNEQSYISGTSFATPQRTAREALIAMLRGKI